jgi:hypothetical protein
VCRAAEEADVVVNLLPLAAVATHEVLAALTAAHRPVVTEVTPDEARRYAATLRALTTVPSPADGDALINAVATACRG